MRQKTRDDLGLALTMLDSDRLREWAEKLDTHGSDISHWADRRFVSEQLRAVAGRIEDTVREVSTLRELAAKDALLHGMERRVCNNCDGTGKVHSHNPECWVCDGTGKVSPQEER